jgi:hypothetical protein
MLTITGQIEGVAPLLFSRPYSDLEGPGGKPSPEEKAMEAFNRLHRDEQGAYIPSNMFKQSVLAGAKAGNVKNGRASYATLLEATMFTRGQLYLGKDTYDEVFEHWGRRPPGPRGAAIMLRYPLFRVGWTAQFTLVLTQGDKHTVEAVRQSLEAAGMLVGLGSWRPEYGRFIVTDFEAK